MLLSLPTCEGVKLTQDRKRRVWLTGSLSAETLVAIHPGAHSLRNEDQDYHTDHSEAEQDCNRSITCIHPPSLLKGNWLRRRAETIFWIILVSSFLKPKLDSQILESEQVALE